MPNPYILLAFALALAGSNWWSYNHGLSVAEGEQAERELTIANAYLEAGRRNAEAESAASLRRAKAAAEARAKAADARHQLEMELAKDEAARTCRVGDATYRLLNDAISSANGGAAPKTGGVNGSGAAASSTGRTNRSNAGAVDQPRSGAVR